MGICQLLAYMDSHGNWQLEVARRLKKPEPVYGSMPGRISHNVDRPCGALLHARQGSMLKLFALCESKQGLLGKDVRSFDGGPAQKAKESRFAV